MFSADLLAVVGAFFRLDLIELCRVLGIIPTRGLLDFLNEGREGEKAGVTNWQILLREALLRIRIQCHLGP